MYDELLDELSELLRQSRLAEEKWYKKNSKPYDKHNEVSQ